MADLKQMKEGAAKVGSMVVGKAKDAKETAYLKMQLRGKKSEVSRLYAALGKVYFTKHQNDEYVPEEVLFNGIRHAESELADLKQMLGE